MKKRGLPSENKRPISQGGAEKWKSSNDDKHGQGQEKRRPSTYVEGKKVLCVPVFDLMLFSHWEQIVYASRCPPTQSWMLVVDVGLAWQNSRPLAPAFRGGQVWEETAAMRLMENGHIFLVAIAQSAVSWNVLEKKNEWCLGWEKQQHMNTKYITICRNPFQNCLRFWKNK